MKTSKIFLLLIAVLVVLYLLNFRLTSSSVSADNKGGSGDWTIYGTTSCGWTRKQIEYMKSKNISYNFVDCNSEDCKGITGFPTLKKSDGTTTIVGFSSSL